MAGLVAGLERRGGGRFRGVGPRSRGRDGVARRLFAFNHANDVIYGFCRHGRVAENFAADLDVVDASEENIAHHRVGEVDAPAVGGSAPRAIHGVGAGDDEVTVRHGAADGRGEVSERFTELLLALQGLTSTDAD